MLREKVADVFHYGVMDSQILVAGMNLFKSAYFLLFLRRFSMNRQGFPDSCVGKPRQLLNTSQTNYK
jgi:hypothetical protein